MPMPWWGLLIEVFVVWLLWGVAAVASRAASEARRGIPEGQRAGVSLAPIIPAFPLAFCSVAWLADVAICPWGTVIVGWFHAALGVVFVASIARDWRHLQALGQRAEPGAPPDPARDEALPEP